MPGRASSNMPLTVEESLSLLSRQHEAAQLHAAVVWDAAVAMHRAGVPVELLAPAVGMSVRSFYRRLASRE